jgi:hypothetical protein
MPAEDAVHREALEQAILDHPVGAATAFLGGLEHQADGAAPAFILQQQRGGAQQRRGVAIMPAGMHHVLHGAAPGQLAGRGGFLDRQGVHVPAQPDAAVAARTVQRGNDAMAAYPLGDVGDTEFLQLLHDEGRGAPLMQSKTWIGVEMPAPTSQCFGKCGVHVLGHSG